MRRSKVSVRRRQDLVHEAHGTYMLMPRASNRKKYADRSYVTRKWRVIRALEEGKRERERERERETVPADRLVHTYTHVTTWSGRSVPPNTSQTGLCNPPRDNLSKVSEGHSLQVEEPVS